MTNLLNSRRTPYDDDYQTCLETRCILTIYPDKIAPDEVSRHLGLEPSSTHRAGEVRVNRRGGKFVYPANGWFLSSENYVTSKDLRRHLDWLLAKLQPTDLALKELQKEPNLTMNINCVWWSRGSGGPTLWPEQMLAIANLNLECSFDIYYEDDNES